MTSATDYDPIADTYAAGVDQRLFNALYERPATLALLPEVSGLAVLDAGCGPGWYAQFLVEHGADVIAVDASARMADLAAARHRRRRCARSHRLVAGAALRRRSSAALRGMGARAEIRRKAGLLDPSPA